uniref:EF-hand domain-containing protein n=2 Tax=Caenorhabditis tropicalis TaxID=1561998 RepID=A0A1I7UZB1_9PELO
MVDNKSIKAAFESHSKTKKGKLSRSEAKKALADLGDETSDFSNRWKKYSDGGFVDLGGFLQMTLPITSSNDAPLKSYSGHHSETHKSESKKKKDKKTFEEEKDEEKRKRRRKREKEEEDSEVDRRRHRIKKTEEHEEEKDKEEHHMSNDENFEFDTSRIPRRIQNAKRDEEDPSEKNPEKNFSDKKSSKKSPKTSDDEIQLEKDPEFDSAHPKGHGHHHCCCGATDEHEHTHHEEFSKTDKVVNKHHDCAKCQSSSQPPILPTVSRAEEPSCTNDAFDCVEEHSARKIEERRRARQQALQYSPRADLTLRKIDPEIGKALAVEQLMRDSLVFDSLPRPPKGNVEIVAAKRDYL